MALQYTEQFTWGAEQDPEPPVTKRHWGKYRGTVVQNVDAPPRGRLQVTVPGILTTPNWAMPCVPVAALMKSGGSFMRPEIGSNVWIEFERGDPDKPIWVGCFWGEADLPRVATEYVALPEVQVITLESLLAGISISDAPIAAGATPPGQVNIFADGGVVAIALSPNGVNISAPTVTITAGAFNVVTPTGTFTVG